jgi:hypothetical protein
MSTIPTWSPYQNYVQANLVGGQFLSGAYTLIAAGPPRLAAIGGAGGVGALLDAGGAEIALPVGLIQNMALQQSHNVSKIFEIGSERAYQIGGRVLQQLSLGRILYHGPSLLRMAYAYYADYSAPTVIDPLFENLGTKTMPNPHNVKIQPGYENLFLNLASDLFKQPVGFLFYFKDSNEDTVGSFYLEDTYCVNHGLTTDANGIIMNEDGSFQPERIRPVAVSQLALIHTDVPGVIAG